MRRLAYTAAAVAPFALVLSIGGWRRWTVLRGDRRRALKALGDWR